MIAGEIESDVGDGEGVAPCERDAETVDVEEGPNVFVVETVSEIDGVTSEVRDTARLDALLVNVEPMFSEGVAVEVVDRVPEAVLDGEIDERPDEVDDFVAVKLFENVAGALSVGLAVELEDSDSDWVIESTPETELTPETVLTAEREPVPVVEPDAERDGVAVNVCGLTLCAAEPVLLAVEDGSDVPVIPMVTVAVSNAVLEISTGILFDTVLLAERDDNADKDKESECVAV